MNKVFQLLGKGLFAILMALLIILAITIKPIDNTPYQQTDFYRNELDELNNLQLWNSIEFFLTKVFVPIIQCYQSAHGTVQINRTEISDKLEVGWSKSNILPAFTTPIAIDADRNGKHWNAVHDSIFVRAFVFKKNNIKVAYVSADLLIIPPLVVREIDSLLVKKGFSSNNIYYTATHTHSSIGAWHPSIIGELFAGKFDARVVSHLANCFAQAITDAEKNSSNAKVGYIEIPTQNLVVNRLVDKAGKVDDKLRVIKIAKATGERAAIVTFAAHATCLHKGTMEISGDWPSAFMRNLEASNKIEFACHSAGAVGSQGPFEAKKNKWEEVNYMADSLAALVLRKIDSVSVTDTLLLNFEHLPLYLRAPNLRISESWVLRPWVFNLLFGTQKVYINLFEIGSIKLIGMPCDFSGELSVDIHKKTQSKNNSLLITSFNGGFIGYITDDKWYNKKSYETWTMNWFGPENGAYLSEIICKLLSIH